MHREIIFRDAMDEIICPICGKQNITSSKICRYCQAPLDKGGHLDPSKNHEELFDTDSLKSSSKNHPPASKPAMKDRDTKEENLPEWLKRVRELKKADEAKEREKDQWRQQNLFNPENQKQKHKYPEPEKKSTPPKRVQISSAPVSEDKDKKDDAKRNAETSVEPETELADNEISEFTNDDLPDGFTPFPSKNDTPDPNQIQ